MPVKSPAPFQRRTAGYSQCRTYFICPPNADDDLLRQIALLGRDTPIYCHVRDGAEKPCCGVTPQLPSGLLKLAGSIMLYHCRGLVFPPLISKSSDVDGGAAAPISFCHFKIIDNILHELRENAGGTKKLQQLMKKRGDAQLSQQLPVHGKAAFLTEVPAER